MRGVFRTQSNICDGAFLPKYLRANLQLTFPFGKIPAQGLLSQHLVVQRKELKPAKNI